jgi:hypothetical protein
MTSFRNAISTNEGTITMNQLLRFAICTAMLLNFTTANAGLFDIFKARDAHYQQDVTACWSAVSESIPAKNRNMDDFRIEHQGTNPNTGRRGVVFHHSQGLNIRGCVFESNGAIISILGGKS